MTELESVMSGRITPARPAKLTVPSAAIHEEDVRVSLDLPPLPMPCYAVIRIGCSPGVPAEVVTDLLQSGVPGGPIGYEYQPPSETALLSGVGDRGLVIFGSSSLGGRIGIDIASRRVVHIPTPEYRPPVI